MDSSIQLPVEGVMLLVENGPSRMYKVACKCGDPAHDITVDIDADDMGVTVHHYAEVATDAWSNTTLINPFRWLWIRIRLTFKLWTAGHLTHEAWTVMSERQALNYANTLIEAVNHANRIKQETSSQPG